MLTLEEQERRAYIAGDTRTADLLAHAIEGDDELAADLQMAEEQRDAAQKYKDDMEEDLESTKEHLDSTKDDLVAAKGALDEHLTYLRRIA